MSWINRYEHIPDNAFGFIYKITHIPTGKFYIGKKQLHYNRKRPPLKGYKRNRRVKTESDWQTYYGSSDWIMSQVSAGNAADFKREILMLCFSKKSLTYNEIKYQFHYDVLNNPKALNITIQGKFYKGESLDSDLFWD